MKKKKFLSIKKIISMLFIFITILLSVKQSFAVSSSGTGRWAARTMGF